MEHLYYGQTQTFYSDKNHCYIELERKIAEPHNPRSFALNPENEHLLFTEFYTFHPYQKSPDDNEYDTMEELLEKRYGGIKAINENGNISVLLTYKDTEDGQIIFSKSEDTDAYIDGIITYSVNPTLDMSIKDVEELLLDMVDAWNDYINENEYCFITVKDKNGQLVECMAADVRDDSNYFEDVIYVGDYLGLDLSDMQQMRNKEHFFEEER